MAESAAYLVDQVIPRVPVRQWVLSFPIPLRMLFAAHPELLTPVLRIIPRVIARFLLKQAGLKRCAADSGAVTLIQRFGSAANLNIHLQQVLSLRTVPGRDEKTTPALCAEAHGFSLHGGVRCGAHQRKELERLCRYITRPAIANERLKRTGEGQVVLQLKSAWARRHHAHQDVAAGSHAALGRAGAASAPASDPFSWRARMGWARLLKRVFDIDLEHCPQCGGELKIIAAIEEPAVIVKILTHLGLPARAPPRSPARPLSLFQAA